MSLVQEITSAIVFILAMFGWGAYDGIKLRMLRMHGLVRPKRLILSHVAKASAAVLAIIPAAYFIERAVRASDDPYREPYLLAFHLTIVFVFLATIAAIFIRFNGLRSLRWHGRLGYASYSLLVVVAVTGFPMFRFLAL